MSNIDIFGLEESVLSTLSTEYSLDPSAIDLGILSNAQATFHVIAKNAECVRAGILDLGCGSIYGTDAKRKPKDDPFSRQFEPWLLRMLEITGRIEPQLKGKLLGVDLMKQGKNEKFPWIASDLSLEPNGLSDLPAQSFGIVNNTMFAAQTAAYGAVSPTLYTGLQGDRRALVQTHINVIQHAKRLLVPNGYYIENANMFKKADAGLEGEGQLYGS